MLRVRPKNCMLHFFYRWRYERNSRNNAYKLPPMRRKRRDARVDLGDYLARQSIIGQGFRHYDLPRRRRKWALAIASLVGTLLLVWITYESIIALAAMGD